MQTEIICESLKVVLCGDSTNGIFVNGEKFDISLQDLQDINNDYDVYLEALFDKYNQKAPRCLVDIESDENITTTIDLILIRILSDQRVPSVVEFKDEYITFDHKYNCEKVFSGMDVPILKQKVLDILKHYD